MRLGGSAVSIGNAEAQTEALTSRTKCLKNLYCSAVMLLYYIVLSSGLQESAFSRIL